MSAARIVRAVPEESAAAPAVARRSLLRRIYDWTLAWGERPGGRWALFVIAFMESSFFPIPPDVLLVALCVGAPRRALRLAAVCTAGSVLGGMFGYLIGWGAWEWLQGFFIPHLFSAAAFAKVEQLYQQNALIAILTAAFTPIPYKVFTIAAGVFHVDFATLVVGSSIGRGLRFGLVALLIRTFGPPVKVWIEKYFDLLAWLALALLVAGFAAVKLWGH